MEKLTEQELTTIVGGPTLQVQTWESSKGLTKLQINISEVLTRRCIKNSNN